MRKKYKIIYADPPWSYRDKALSGTRGAICKYPVMTEEQLATLQIENIADKDCVLFMWATAPKIGDAVCLLTEWGFNYKTIAFTWIKKNKKSGTNFWGMGNWTRANAEFVLLGIRGKPKRISKSIHSVVETIIARHSEKPDEVRKRIIDLMGDLPRIELFARNRVEGWDAFGNEVKSDITVDDLSFNSAVV